MECGIDSMFELSQISKITIDVLLGGNCSGDSENLRMNI